MRRIHLVGGRADGGIISCHDDAESVAVRVLDPEIDDAFHGALGEMHEHHHNDQWPAVLEIYDVVGDIGLYTAREEDDRAPRK